MQRRPWGEKKWSLAGISEASLGWMGVGITYREAHGVRHVGPTAAVEVLLQHLVNLGGEGDVVVGELAPGHQQQGDGVVVEAAVPVRVRGDEAGGGQLIPGLGPTGGRDAVREGVRQEPGQQYNMHTG
jgi:hypothetical protein